MKTYQFELFALSLADCAKAGILKKKKSIRKPVTAIILAKDASETYLPWEAWLTFGDREGDENQFLENKQVYEVNWPKSPIPSNVDYKHEQDYLLPELIEKFALDSDWGRIELLRMLLNSELELAFRKLINQLKKEGIPIDKGCSLYWMCPDGLDSVNDRAFYEKVIGKELKAHFKGKPELLAQFSKYCYKSKAKQKWLCSLI